jgi:hypothetical protein
LSIPRKNRWINFEVYLQSKPKIYEAILTKILKLHEKCHSVTVPSIKHSMKNFKSKLRRLPEKNFQEAKNHLKNFKKRLLSIREEASKILLEGVKKELQ